MINKLFFKLIPMIICVSLVSTDCTNHSRKINAIDNNSSKNISNTINDYNHASLELDDLSKHIKILDDAIPNYEVFLTGENHFVDVNFPLETFFLEYLVTYGNIKYFLPEVSHSIGCGYDEYLKTGDENILNELCKKQHMSVLATNQNIKDWKNLKRFYDTLPQDKKFKVIGIDVEDMTNIAADYIYKKLSIVGNLTNFPLLCEFKKVYETNDLENQNIFRDHPIYQITEKIQKDLISRKAEYQKLFGGNFFDISMVIEGVPTTHGSDDQITDLNIREKQIVKTFNQYMNIILKVNIMGNGEVHIFH
ncbi:hypothetical protein [Clostridium sp. JN-9]|uniref:hypothetical protein n=1 Tax=Clostridium sp. JN-9 TaxID=2507159 RepID=UPI000FFE0816|nr:hypothetical protein [Clostridium sp. JN-9]QAT38916.1 hypothetical protein EQM05_00805 [Clostridium sp. JN-9]